MRSLGYHLVLLAELLTQVGDESLGLRRGGVVGCVGIGFGEFFLKVVDVALLCAEHRLEAVEVVERVGARGCAFARGVEERRCSCCCTESRASPRVVITSLI